MTLSNVALHAANLAATVLILGTAVAHLGPQPAPPGLIPAPPGPARVLGPAEAPTPALRTSARPSPRTADLCLSLNAYYEARGEGDRGMATVTRVAINRAAAGYRGKDGICATVYDPAQFSWTHENPAPADPVRLAHVKRIVRGVQAGHYIDRAPGALHYYNPDKVTPGWAAAYQEVAVIGNHRFMR